MSAALAQAKGSRNAIENRMGGYMVRYVKGWMSAGVKLWRAGYTYMCSYGGVGC